MFILLLFFTLDLHAKEDPYFSFWIKVIDQDGKPITEATLYYCIFDCALTRNSHNRKNTLTDESGYAEVKLKGNDKVRIQGIEKDGYDIRLKTLPYNEVRLHGIDKQPKRSNYFNPYHGINIRYEKGIKPYSQPISKPLFTITGWKLGLSACLEQDHKFIPHRNRGESNWDIDEESYFFKVGDKEDTLRIADANDYDIRLTVDRSHYPWTNIINRFIASYNLELAFKNGGAQAVAPENYIHVAPKKGYKKKVDFDYRGIGDISVVHHQRVFFKVGKRYGVLNLEITPSQSIFFEYLLNRKPNQTELNIPFYMGDYGIASDYFSNPPSASVMKPKTTHPCECANLGLSRFGG
jgi:hypothetical protein